MKQLVIAAGVLALIFASTFLILNGTGVLTLDYIEITLDKASSVNPLYVASIIALLLFLDLFIAVPTLTLAILSGYFLGFWAGGVCAFAGMLAAGLAGFGISFKYGPGLLIRIYKDPTKLSEMQRVFSKHGALILMMCRAAPILPEVACCLAGATKMPIYRFLLFYVTATAPYALIAAYAGSKSTLANPTPAIFAAIAMSLALWGAWVLFLRRNYRHAVRGAHAHE